jgi:hypothetical protein
MEVWPKIATSLVMVEEEMIPFISTTVNYETPLRSKGNLRISDREDLTFYGQ